MIETPSETTLEHHTRGYHVALVLLPVLLVVFVGLFVGLYVTHTTTRVHGPSMAPTLLPEDILLVTRGYDSPIRGDVVVVRSLDPDDAGELLVKRVIGIPGDEVSVVDGRALVNGESERGPYTVYVSAGDINVSLLTVPPGAVYVLGDNRPVSSDSRIFGPQPLDTVVGRVISIIAPINRARRVD
ncbi:MAG: signal peptidase I [Coriobacteriia bacterium]